MLRLIGYSLTRRGATLDIPDEDRLANMRRARARLIARTGKDFGFDLERWDRYLLENHLEEYGHPYAYQAVRDEVQKAREDPRREAVIRQHAPSVELDQADRHMAQTAHKLIAKYMEPNPPRAGEPVDSTEGLQNAWRWAEERSYLEVLAALALPMTALVPTEERLRFYAELENYQAACDSPERAKQRADFLLAMAKLEQDRWARADLYEEAMRIYAGLKDWGGEAYCAHRLAGLLRYWQRFDEWETMVLHAFRIWSEHEHERGMAIASIHLSEALERRGKFVESCQLLYRARESLEGHIEYITARDLLKRVSYEMGFSPEEYRTSIHLSRLVQAFFE